MARGFKMGGGSTMIGGDATPDDVLEGKSIYVGGEEVIGRMHDVGQYINYMYDVNYHARIIPGYHDGTGYIDLSPEDKLRLIASNIRKDITILGITGEVEEGTDTSDATAAAGDILSGKIAYARDNKITGTIPSQAAKTITPLASAQTAVAAGTYCTGNVTVNAIPNQVAAKTVTPLTSAQTAVNAGSYTTGAITLGAIPNQVAAKTVTPSASAQTAVAAGSYTTGAITLGAIPNRTIGGAKYATTSAQTIVSAGKYVTTNITLGALSQSNLASGNILRGKTITISNGSSNVWSVSGSNNILRCAVFSTNSSSTQKAYYKNDNESENMYVTTVKPDITPVYAFWYGYDAYTTGFRSGATTWNIINFKDNTGRWSLYVTTSKNSGWRFTSTAVDIPACYSGKWQAVYVFGY